MSLLLARIAQAHRAPVSSGHRYWRYYITANGAGPTNDVEPGSGWRVVSGGSYIIPASASSSSNYSGNTAMGCWSIGGAGWQTASGSIPAWNAVDFGSPKTIIELAIKGPSSPYVNRMAAAFTVQWSDTGTSGPWTDAKSFSGLSWGNSETKVFSLL